MDLVNRLSVVLKGLAAADRIVFWPDQEMSSDMDDLRSALLAAGVGASARACTGLEMREEAGTAAALRPVWVALFEDRDSEGRMYIRDVQVSLGKPDEAPGVRLRQAALQLGDPVAEIAALRQAVDRIAELEAIIRDQRREISGLNDANAQFAARQWADKPSGRCAHGFADGQPCCECAALVRDDS